MLGSLQSAVAAGSLFGPLMGGMLVSTWGFRPVLLLMGMMTMISAGVAGLYLQEHHQEHYHVAAQPQSQTKSAGGIRQSFLDLIQLPQTSAFIGAGIAAKAAVFGLVGVFAPFVREVVQAPTAEAAATWVGLLQAATWSATFLGATWWGQQNDRRAVEQNYIWAAMVCSVSIALQPFLPYLPWLLLLRIVQGFCFSALEPSVFLVVARTSTGCDRGVRIGATNSLLVTGQIIGAFGSSILGGFLDTRGLFIVMAGLLGLGAVGIGLIHPAKN